MEAICKNLQDIKTNNGVCEMKPGQSSKGAKIAPLIKNEKEQCFAFHFTILHIEVL